MRTTWNLTLRLGELAIPVGLSPTRRERDEKFRKLHNVCQTPIGLRPYCAPDGQLVDPADLVTAWEVAKGEYVILDPDEVAALEPPASRTLRIGGFVPAGSLPGQTLDRGYYLAPSTVSRVAVRPYKLLSAAVAELEVAAVGRFVAWGVEKLCAITATSGGGLLLQTLLHAEDTIGPDELHDELHDVEVADDELALALELVERMTRKLRPADLAGSQRPLVRAMLERKLAGQPIVRPRTPPEPEPASTVDLTAALRASIRNAPRRRRATAAAR